MEVKRKSSLRKKGKGLCGFLLALCMAVTTTPALNMTVYAAPGDAIQYGTDVLKTNMNTGTAATVYFGVNSGTPIAWRVIGYDGTGVASTDGNITLITTGTLGTTKFDNDGTSNVYSGSDLKSAVEGIASGLSNEEITLAVVKRTLAVGSYNKTNPSETDGVAGTEVTGAVLWPLSAKEANAMNFNLRECGKVWWLRSPGENNSTAEEVIRSGLVNDDGNYVALESGVRPAFYLNLDSVLFTSAAAGGKSNFSAVGTNLTNEWKLTLKDDTSTGFNATLPTEGKTGGSVTVNVTAPGSGTHNQTSAMLVDGSNQVVAYGKIGDTTTGDKIFTIPATIPTGSYMLKVFQEQVNGDKKTDYAGNVVEGSITISCGHTNVHTIANKSATCTAFGVKDYYQCADCKKYFSDSACTSEIANLDTWKAGDGKIEKTAHTPGTAYTSDNDNHWLTCTVCNAELTRDAHQESDTYTHDATNHWKTCTVCGAKLNSTAHDIDANGICTDCGYNSTCTHTYGTGAANGATGHTKTCSKCSDVIMEAHISGGSATATSPEVCNVCGYEISPALGGGTSGGDSASTEIDRLNPFVNYLQTTTGKIANAKEGATVTIDLGDFNVLTLAVMKQMAMRRDLTIQMEYSYKGQKYEVTFPAGMPIKYQDDIRYYGPLKLADMAMRGGGMCQIR